MIHGKTFFQIFICIQLLLVGCKNNNILELEAAIDEFLYRKNQSPLQIDKLEELKSKFEYLNKIFNNNHEKVSVLFYLSEIALLQEKFNEAHHFIIKAYEISHADSIYKQREKTKSLITESTFRVDSNTTNILWFNDTDNKMLIFDIQKSNYIADKTIKDSNLIDQKSYALIEDVMTVGRDKIQQLYNEKKYSEASYKAEILITILKDLSNKTDVKKELSQLYEDIAILYAQQNKIVEAKEAIKKALELNPTKKNQEISNLLNK